MRLNKRIEPYMELNEIEHIFYTLFQENSLLKKQNLLRQYADCSSLSKKLFFQEILKAKGFLPENAFFHEHQTIYINSHPRYMPSYKHTHDFFEIQFLLSGQVRQCIGGFNVTLQTGDICFISPAASHNPEVYNHDTIMINILLRTKTLQSAFSNCLAGENEIATFFMRILCGHTYHPYLLWHTNDDTQILNLILDMLDYQKECDIYTDRLLHTMVEQLFIYLLRNHPNDFSTGTFQKKEDENILSIIKYAQANFSSITLKELAKRFNYNESYLSRMLKTYLGRSFSSHIIELRLKKATELLTTTNTPVSEILLQVGYMDKTHFYRSFQKKYGMTPSVYRKEDSLLHTK